MQINLPSHVNVEQKAAAAGFGQDVQAYVAHLIENDQPARLGEVQLQQSLAMIEQGEADIEAGRVQDLRQALLDIGSKYGFQLPE